MYVLLPRFGNGIGQEYSLLIKMHATLSAEDARRFVRLLAPLLDARHQNVADYSLQEEEDEEMWSDLADAMMNGDLVKLLAQYSSII